MHRRRGQGYPETEKLLLSNLFEVSIDYLLKSNEPSQDSDDNGYYVNKEKAMAYVVYEQRITKRMGLGFSIFLCSGMSFLIFEETSPYAVLGSVLFFLLGLLIMIPRCL